MTEPGTKAEGDNITSAWANSLRTMMGSGIPAESCTYTVFYDSDTSEYKARNGQTGAIDYSGADPATVINSAIAASGHVHLKNVTYTLTSELLAAFTGSSIWPDNPVIIEGEGDDTVLYAATAINIIHFTRTDAMRSNLIVRNLRISGNALATAINLTGAVYGVADQHFENVFIYNCAKGITGAMCDTKLDNVSFNTCVLGAEIMQSGVQFFRCMFRTCTNAVSFNNTSPSHTGFFGCVFSGNDYVFNFDQVGHSFACYACWFENSGEACGHQGDASYSNMFKTSLPGSSNFIRAWKFDQCYFSADENFDASWIDGQYWQDFVKFEGCSFVSYDDYTKFNRSSFYPRMERCVGYTAGGTAWEMKTETWGITNISSGNSISHGLSIQPTWIMTQATEVDQHAWPFSAGTSTFFVYVRWSSGAVGTTQYVYWKAGF